MSTYSQSSDPQSPGPMFRRPKNLRQLFVTGALATGTMLGAAGAASAATTSTSTTTTSTSTATPPTGTPPSGAPKGDPATMTHGPDETLLTGTKLAQATVAAQAAMPEATIVRAETDSSDDYPYEVHLKKSDGTYVTVELDSSFTVVKTVTGFGAPPAGNKGPSGTPPSGTAPSGKPPSGTASTGTSSSSTSTAAA